MANSADSPCDESCPGVASVSAAKYKLLAGPPLPPQPAAPKSTSKTEKNRTRIATTTPPADDPEIGSHTKKRCQTENRNDREALRLMKHPASGARHYQNHRSTIQNDYGGDPESRAGTNRFVLGQAGRRGAVHQKKK